MYYTRLLLLWATFHLTTLVTAQQTAHFENYSLSPESPLNDAAPENWFISGRCALPNFYHQEFSYWEGWAISNITDNTTPGYLNQYSAIPGKGAEGSDHYAVSYAYNGAVLHLLEEAAGQPVEGLWVTNSTFAYWAMRDGDAFAKRFGGETGQDPDFFSLTIHAWHLGQSSQDSVVFYLADFRSPDPAKDYITQDWQWLSLEHLGPADSLTFTLRSSDMGDWGMNTPAYFCVDQVRTAGTSSSTEQHYLSDGWQLWPNPGVAELHLQIPPGMDWLDIISLSGQVLHRERVQTGTHRSALHHLPSGAYVARLHGSGRSMQSVWVKQ